MYNSSILLCPVALADSHRVIMPPGEEPPIFAEFREILPADVALQPLDRFAFYAAAKDDSVALLIATGEERTYANILLTIGVVH